MKINLYVLYGGKSVEHEVSLKTAFTVLHAIDRNKYDVYPVYITREGLWCAPGRQDVPAASVGDLELKPEAEDVPRSMGDALLRCFGVAGPKVALPLLHGSNGEDGTVQGLLELLDIPYVGNGVLSSAVTLDKDVAKRLLEQAGIRQTKHICIRLTDWQEEGRRLLERVRSEIGFPCYVKPSSLGSSIGISRCENEAELSAGVEEAFRFDAKLVVEREIDGREIQVAVMGNERPIASLPGEFVHRQRFFDYETKYFDKELAMSIPAALPDGLTERIREAAVRAYAALCCSGLARVDFFLDAAGELYINEINALPGFTSASMYPVMWERTDGTTYAELVEKLIDYAWNRHTDKQALQYAR
jgi:D-alanine--D-alanine ligase